MIFCAVHEAGLRQELEGGGILASETWRVNHEELTESLSISDLFYGATTEGEKDCITNVPMCRGRNDTPKGVGLWFTSSQKFFACVWPHQRSLASIGSTKNPRL